MQTVRVATFDVPGASPVMREVPPRAAVFLASDEAGCITGHVLNVDGGFDAAGFIFEPEEAE